MTLDNIYDTSDVRRKLIELGEQRRQATETKRRRTKGTIKGGKDLLSMWSSETRGKTKELLALKDQGKAVFEMNPDYIGKSGFSKFFTPSGGRVRPIEAEGIPFTGPRAAEYLEAHPELQGPKTIGEQVSKSAKGLTETSEKFFGSPLGKWLSGAGALAGAYELNKNWDKKSDTDKILGLGKTVLGAASIFKPALGIWGLGHTLADMVFD